MVVFIGVSYASRLVGFYLQEAVGGAPAFMRLAVVGAFVVVVPHTVVAGSARFALHDTAHTLVGIVFYVEQCAVHLSKDFCIEYRVEPRQ